MSATGQSFWLWGHPNQEGPRLVFVPVAAPRREKDRVHVAIVPTDFSQTVELGTRHRSGAPVVNDRRHMESGGWVVCADRESKEFCLEGD